MRRLITRALLLALLLAALWGAWYVNKRGFSESWRNRVEAELLKHGVATNIRRLTLDPVRGLTAQDVSVYRSVERDEELATISQISLDVNIGNMLRGGNFLNAVDLRHSNLRVPLPSATGDGGTRILDISGLDARIVFPPGQIRVTKLEFSALGVDVAATGTLLMPEGFVPNFEGDGGQPSPPWLDTLLDTLSKIQYPDGPPQLSLEFSGDVSAMDSLRIESASIECGSMLLDHIQFRALHADLDYEDRKLTLRRLILEDARGSLQAKGYLRLDTGQGNAQILCTLDLQPLLAGTLDFPALKELTFFREPRIEAFLSMDRAREHSLKLVGNVSAESVAVRSIVFESFGCQFAWEGPRLLLRNLALVHKSGRLDAQFLAAPEEVKVSATSTMDPVSLIPLLDRSSRQLLSEWLFDNPPTIRIQGSGKSLQTLRLSGDLAVGRADYRGVELLEARSKLEIFDRQVVYRDFFIRRKEGTGSGTFIYDFGRGEARLENIVSDMQPDKVAMWIDPEFVDDVMPYRFRKSARVVANGVVRLGGRPGTRLTLDISGAEGMDYTFLGKDLPLENVSGRLKIVDYSLELQDFQGRLFGGGVQLDAKISLDAAAPDYQCTIRLDGCDFRSITSLYFDYNDSEGKLNGEYSFRGQDTDPARMVGSGRVEVLNGDVFEIPFLGPLTSLLNSIVPGMGLSIADRAFASFTVRDGVINTSNLEVLSTAFTMTGNGDIDFLRDRLDFDIRINAKGLPGILLFPVSKLFEYTAQGTMADPGWRPKIIPNIPGTRGAPQPRTRAR